MAHASKGTPDKGGPGAAHRGGTKPARAAEKPRPGAPTNPNRSRVSGGGGERDRRHAHHPDAKKS
jgi:hypothetical protein